MPRKQSALSLYDLSAKKIIEFMLKLNSLGRQLERLDHNILNDSTKQVIDYLATLPKPDLQNMLDKVVKLQKMNNLSNQFYAIPDMILFLPLGVPLSLTFPVKCISFPIIDFMKMYSTNLVSLTLGNASNNLSKSSIRTLLTWLDNLERLVVCDSSLMDICLPLLTTPLMLPKLKSALFQDHPQMCVCYTSRHCPCQKAMAEFLMTHSNLTNLSFYGSLSIFQKINEAGRKLNLTCLDLKNWLNHKIGDAGLGAVAATCQDISSLDISSYFGDNLIEIANFENLSRLILNNQSDSNTFEQLISTVTLLPNLTDLSITRFHDVCVNNLTKAAPKLEEVHINYCSFKEVTILKNGFEHLKNIYVIKPRNNTFTGNVMLALLSRAVNLTKFEFRGNMQYFTDELFNDLLKKNPLRNLRNMHVSTCNMTIISVLTLLANDSDLTDIQIRSNGLFNKDVAAIKKYIIQNNLAVIIVAIGSHGMWTLVNNKVY